MSDFIACLQSPLINHREEIRPILYHTISVFRDQTRIILSLPGVTVVDILNSSAVVIHVLVLIFWEDVSHFFHRIRGSDSRWCLLEQGLGSCVEGFKWFDCLSLRWRLRSSWCFGSHLRWTEFTIDVKT